MPPPQSALAPANASSSGGISAQTMAELRLQLQEEIVLSVIARFEEGVQVATASLSCLMWHMQTCSSDPVFTVVTLIENWRGKWGPVSRWRLTGSLWDL